VRAGDSLWSITAALLPDRATDRDITEGWHRVYRANRARIGPDPDLVVVGTRLVVPSFVSLHERTIREHARAPVRRSAPPATRTG
jgi:hypothetical protein